jgi:predicted nucleic acid-binding protein
LARFSALLDACVLVPVALADTLLRLAEADLYRPLWSDSILDEMVSAIEELHPELADGPARRRSAAMNRAFDDACVRGWEPLVRGIALPDEDDRHVVAAAIRGQADLIVTANLSDFPAAALEPLGLEAQSPDDFLLNQLDLDPDIVIRVLHAQATATQRPAITFDALLAHLTRCGVPRFAHAAAQQKWRSPDPA